MIHMSPAEPRQLELLAPAKDAAIAREAILHGADAVYIGAPAFGARSRAANTIADIASIVEFAAPFGAKVYVTFNTIIYDHELADAERMIRDLYAAGADALIVQDMGILRMDIPPIALHASTQCDIRTPEKARFLANAGFSQIVIARELSLNETAAICEAVDVPVEAFVHGALCVSYSGDCQASCVTTGRSSNRGECAQMCRLPYDLIDGNGNMIGRQRHYLSLRDMNRIGSLVGMIDAGVTSFKIEGRLKDKAYVKNVTAAYRQALDSIIEANPDRYCRSSRGFSEFSFKPSLDKCFNRGYTVYFLHGPSSGNLATLESPKAMGEPIGHVTSVRGKIIGTDQVAELSNGDGMTYMTSSGETGGFRINRTEGTRLYLLRELHLPVGTRLFRNHDRKWEEMMEKDTATRYIPIDITLRKAVGNRLILEGSIDGLRPVCVAMSTDMQPAKSPDNGYRQRTLTKLGDTVFRYRKFTDRTDGIFIPASALTILRRNLTAAITATLRAIHIPDRRREPPTSPVLPEGYAITRHDNIANDLAEAFYRDCGATGLLPRAVETMSGLNDREMTVMTTRYCLRRELGACLKGPSATKVKGPLCLVGAGFTYRLDFDCANCQMKVVAIPTKNGQSPTNINP